MIGQFILFRGGGQVFKVKPAKGDVVGQLIQDRRKNAAGGYRDGLAAEDGGGLVLVSGYCVDACDRVIFDDLSAIVDPDDRGVSGG